MRVSDNSDFSVLSKLIKQYAKLIFLFPLFLCIFLFFLYLKFSPLWEVEGTFTVDRSFLGVQKLSQKEILYFLNNPTQNSSFSSLSNYSLTAKIIPDTSLIRFKLKNYSEEAILNDIKLLEASLNDYFLVELNRLKVQDDYHRGILSTLNDQLYIKFPGSDQSRTVISFLIANSLAEIQIKLKNYLIISTGIQSGSTVFHVTFSKPRLTIYSLHICSLFLFMYFACVFLLAYSIVIFKSK